MEKKYITKNQFLGIIFLFILSNDMIRGYFVRDIQQHVWLTTAISIPLAIFLFYIYSFIYKNTNNVGFKQAMELIVGKFLSKVLFAIYFLYFSILLFFSLRDLIELIHIYFVPETMILFIAIGILSTLLYMINKDIETFARVSQFLFTLTIIALLLFSFMLIIINKPNFNGFLPFLPNGFKPLIRPILMMTYGTPMGELFVLMVIFQFVKPLQQKKAYKSAYLGIFLAGIFLLLITIFNVIFIPSKALVFDICPSMRVWRRIDLESYIQRFDLLVLNIIATHTIIKLFVLLFSSKILLGNIVNIKKNNIYALIIAIIVAVTIHYFSKNYNTILTIRFYFIIPYLNLVFEVGLPLVIVVISFLRKSKIKKLLKIDYNN